MTDLSTATRPSIQWWGGGGRWQSPKPETVNPMTSRFFSSLSLSLTVSGIESMRRRKKLFWFFFPFEGKQPASYQAIQRDRLERMQKMKYPATVMWSPSKPRPLVMHHPGNAPPSFYQMHRISRHIIGYLQRRSCRRR